MDKGVYEIADKEAIKVITEIRDRHGFTNDQVLSYLISIGVFVDGEHQRRMEVTNARRQSLDVEGLIVEVKQRVVDRGTPIA